MVVDRLRVRPSQSTNDVVAQLTTQTSGGESPVRHDWLLEEVFPSIQRPGSADFERPSRQALCVETGSRCHGVRSKTRH